MSLVKPIYQRLSDDNLLKKCLHGRTQNQNEAFNGMIWQRIPKEVYVGRDSLEFGLFDAVSHFNQGSKTVLSLYKALQIPPGKYTFTQIIFSISEQIRDSLPVSEELG